jgi:RNA polymerase primary sigma factor
MALRDDFASSHTLAQPSIANVTLPNKRSGKAISEATHQLHPATEAAANLQITALELVCSRKALLALLIEFPPSQQLLRHQLKFDLREGVDYALSCTSVKEYHTEVVQNENIVQLGVNKSVKSVTEVQTGEISFEQVQLFPTALIRLAQLTEALPDLDSDYQQKIMHARRQLQTIRQKMIVTNTGLVTFLACKYKTTNLSFEDLMQEGQIGLIRAVDRFEPERGNCFSTYAVFWIKQAISRLIVKQEKVVRLPVALAEKAAGIFELMRNFYLEHQRWPSTEELHAQSQLSFEEVKTVSRYYQATHSLDASLYEDDDEQNMLDNLQQQQFRLPLKELIDNNLGLYLGNVVASLPVQEANILNMRFGLKNHAEMTLQAIADQLQLTRERVRQIQNQALKKLHQQFGGDLILFLEDDY